MIFLKYKTISTCFSASTYAIADSNDRRSNCQHQQNPVSRNLSMDEALVTIVSKVHHLTIDYQSLGCWQVKLNQAILTFILI